MSIDADISTSEDLFGKTVEDLQEGLTVSNTGISGTSKYVSDYTGFSGDVSMQSGNYIVIHCAVPDVNDATITVEVVNGVSGARTLDPDGLIVLRIADKDTQSIRVVASKTGCELVTKNLSLSGLTLETA